MTTAEASSEPRGTKLVIEPLQRFVIESVPWDEYEALVRLWDGRKLRANYDAATLELMTASFLHRRFQSLWRRLVVTLSLESGGEIASGGEMTFHRRSEGCGLEPDACFWIEHEPVLRGRRSYDIERDPLPDLALEIEVTVSALDRMSIYAKLGFPEVWRFDGEAIHVHQLQDDRIYRGVDASRYFPDLPMAEMTRWLLRGVDEGANHLIRQFTAWIRAGMPRGQQP